MIRRIALILALCLVPTWAAEAAVRASAAAGNWSNPATWTGGVPGDGDEATITHAVIVDGTTTVGTNAGIVAGAGTFTCSGTTVTGSGTAFTTAAKIGDYFLWGTSQRVITAIASDTSLTVNASATVGSATAYNLLSTSIRISGSGSLTVNANLTVKGTISGGLTASTKTTVITQAAGTTVEIDVQSGQRYPLCTNWTSGNYGYLLINGSSGNHAVWRSKAGGGTHWIATAGTTVHWMDATYCDFAGLYDGSANGIQLATAAGSGKAGLARMDHCSVDEASGNITTGAPIAGFTVSFTNNDLRNSANTSSLQSGSGSAAAITITDNTIYRGLTMATATGITCTGNRLWQSGTLGGSGTVPTAFTNNLLSLSDSQVTGGGTATQSFGSSNCYYLYDGPSVNWHPYTNSTAASLTIEGMVFDCTNAATDGNYIIVSPSGSNTYTIQNNLLLPGPSGNPNGDLVVNNCVPPATLKVNHNTITVHDVGELGLSHIGETNFGYTGMFAECFSNYIYSAAGQEGYAIYRFSTRLVQDPVALDGSSNAKLDYNFFKSPVTGATAHVSEVYGPVGGYAASGTGYNLSWKGTTQPTSGDFTLSFTKFDGTGSGSTGAIAFNATRATVVTAIGNALTAAGETGHTVTGVTGTNFNTVSSFGTGTALTFTITKGGNPYPDGQCTVTGNTLNGGGINVAVSGPLFTAASGTYGTHDAVADAQFVDTTRNYASFYLDYLGRSLTSGTWASHAGTDTFAVGDIVSNNAAAWYGGHVTAFRCISSHTKNTANSEPGSGSSWRTYWELASRQAFRDDAMASYSAMTRQATPKDLADWVKGGWAPTNVALKDAGHDSVTVGAVEWVSAGGGGGSGSGSPRIGTSISIGIGFLVPEFTREKDALPARSRRARGPVPRRPARRAA